MVLCSRLELACRTGREYCDPGLDSCHGVNGHESWSSAMVPEKKKKKKKKNENENEE